VRDKSAEQKQHKKRGAERKAPQNEQGNNAKQRAKFTQLWGPRGRPPFAFLYFSGLCWCSRACFSAQLFQVFLSIVRVFFAFLGAFFAQNAFKKHAKNRLRNGSWRTPAPGYHWQLRQGPKRAENN